MALLLLILASALFASGECRGICFVCRRRASQAVAMKRSDMAVAYVFALGSEAVLALALSVAVLGERASALRIGALLLIVLGIVLLERL